MRKNKFMKKLGALIMCLCIGATSVNATDKSRHENETTKEISRGKPKPHPHNHDKHSIPVRIMTIEEATEAANVVKSIGFDNDKVKAAVLFAKLCPIPVEGLEKIAKAIGFEDSRVDFLVQAYPYCVDKENYVKLRKVFTFSKNADDLFNRLGL